MLSLLDRVEGRLIVGHSTIRFTANNGPSVDSHQRDDGVQIRSHLDSVPLRHQDPRSDAWRASACDARLFRIHFVLAQRQEDMSGPIVRTGTTPEFWKNWDKAFGKTAEEGKKAAKGAAK